MGDEVKIQENYLIDEVNEANIKLDYIKKYIADIGIILEKNLRIIIEINESLRQLHAKTSPIPGKMPNCS